MSSRIRHKTMRLGAAIQKFVKNDCHISIGGFTVNRNPMAAVHEIIRQGITGLHLYAHSNGQGLDELTGSGAVSKIEIAYSGNGRFAPTCMNFKRRFVNNEIQVEDYSNFQMSLRFLAGAMGIPFLPTYSSLGTDIIHKWGFNKEMRDTDPRLAAEKLAVMPNPFSREDTPDNVVLVPAINPDVTILHAQKADRNGTTRIHGLTFCDIEQAKAARSVIVTCDEVVEPGILNDDPQLNQLPSFCVDAVVHVPFGAYPTACFGLYDYDPPFLDRYKEMAATQESYDRYMKEYILGTSNHSQYLKMAGQDRLELIKADPKTGYSDRVPRK